MTLHYSRCWLQNSLPYWLCDTVFPFDVFCSFFLLTWQVSKVIVNFTVFLIFRNSEICIITRLTAGQSSNHSSISGRNNIFPFFSFLAESQGHKTSCPMGTSNSSRELTGRGVMVAIDLYLGPILEMSGALPPTPVGLYSMIFKHKEILTFRYHYFVLPSRICYMMYVIYKQFKLNISHVIKIYTYFCKGLFLF